MELAECVVRAMQEYVLQIYGREPTQTELERMHHTWRDSVERLIRWPQVMNTGHLSICSSSGDPRECGVCRDDPRVSGPNVSLTRRALTTLATLCDARAHSLRKMIERCELEDEEGIAEAVETVACLDGLAVKLREARRNF